MSQSTLAGALVAAWLAAAPAASAQCPEPTVTLAPDRGSPAKRVTITGTGLAAGRPVFLHWRSRERKAFMKTRRVARAAGACGEFSARGRYLRGLRTGLWRLQFDHRRRARLATRPRLWGEVSMQRKLVAPFRKFFITLRRGT